ncbi:CpaF/VirB11 family protein [Paracoccus cavernae]|uniref:CpaF/VirB11 family protein n=1 Tax=Paracoccus cavernae TaxID=1571207 RepID=UPI003636033B
MPPASAQGTVIALRLFRPRPSGAEPHRFGLLRDVKRSMEEERAATLGRLKAELSLGSEEAFDAFCREVVSKRLNVLISGITSGGKTELSRRLLWMVEPDQRLVLIQDANELLPDLPNVVSLIADRKESSVRSAERLLEATLRLRPDRIILGELRGIEAITFLEAINTGHEGSFTTIHAQSARKALDRLAFMVAKGGLGMSYGEIQRYVRGAIDVVIQVGRAGDRRGVMEIWMPALDGFDPEAVAP